jgi:hypothetical protein
MGHISITEKDFMAGETQWDYLNNGGFSPDSVYLNLFLKPGVLQFGQSATDRSGSGVLTDSIVASAYDKNFAGNDAYYIGDAGCVYTLSASTLTKRQTITADTFTVGTTDMIQFRGNTYVTGAGRITQLTSSNLTGIDSGWWTGLTTNVRHPLEVVEDKMYIGDLNVVYYYDGTTSGIAVTLPADCNVTSLRRHPDGRHLIAFTGYTQNYSHTVGGPGKIYIINKDTQQWEREILVNNQVEGSRNVDGMIFVTYGKKVGYFTGSGVKFLKQLKTSSMTYSQSMANMEDIFLIRDGVNVLAYGDLGNGKKIWFNFYQGSNTVNNLHYKGQNLILIASNATSLVEQDYSSGGIVGSFVSRRYIFASEVKIRRIVFVHDAKAAGSIKYFNVYYRDTDDALTTLANVKWEVGPTPNRTRIECDLTTDVFQLRVDPSSGVLPIKAIHIYYDGVEAPVNS